jgi:hypothetical protein
LGGIPQILIIILNYRKIPEKCNNLKVLESKHGERGMRFQV